MGLRWGIATVVAGAALAGPATAGAATWTVDPASPPGCGGADTTCRTIGEAAGAVQSGDSVTILAGTYVEAPIVFPASAQNLTIAGSGAVTITSSAAGDVIALRGSGARLSGVVVDVPAVGSSAISVEAANVTLDTVFLQRVAAGAPDAPVLDVTAGPATLARAFVAQAAGSGTPPAVAAAQPLAVSDSILVSTRGPAVTFAEGTANTLIRSAVYATAATANAVEVSSAATSTAKKRLTIESSILSGGANASGLLAKSFGGAISSSAGDIELTARHSTFAGAAKGIVLDASEANGSLLDGAKGSISAAVSGSIVHGASEARRFTGDATHTANTAALDVTGSDAPIPTGNGTITTAGLTATPDAQLFVDPAGRDYHLRADAPVIDTGGTLATGESDRDVDGQPREVDGPDADAEARADRGADEFVNRAPKAVLAASDARPREGTPVSFDASASSDPEAAAGGGIVEYRWDFGDGATAVTAGPTVTHPYAARGTHGATVTVVDRQGAVSGPSAAVELTVRDGTPPSVAITRPRPRAAIARTRRGRPVPLTMAGRASDESGIASVEIALRLVRRAPARRRARAAAGCLWFDGRRGFARRSCDRPLWLRARIRDLAWSRRTRRDVRLPAGSYQLRARATDLNGVESAAASAAARTLVSFRLK